MDAQIDHGSPVTSGEVGETVDIAGIMGAIPHRYPFLLIDRVVQMHKNTSAIGIKNVTINELFLPGPFPQPSGNAGSAHHRGHGADRGRAGG